MRKLSHFEDLVDFLSVILAYAPDEFPYRDYHKEQGQSVWELGWSKRGYTIEAMIANGRGLDPMFETIDIFKDGHDTSIKSMNLNAPSYQNAGRVEWMLRRYVDKVSAFDGGRGGLDEVLRGQTSQRSLIVVIPNQGTVIQREVFRNVQRYGAGLDAPVDVEFRVYP